MTREAMHAVIWDIDGVLLDSEPAHYSALQAVCSIQGISISEDLNRAMLGLGLPDVWSLLKNRYDLNGEFAAWKEAIIAQYIASLNPSMIRPGVAATLKWLDDKGIKLAAVSTAERIIVEANLQNIGIRRHFDPVIAREDVHRTKPFPEPYLKAASILGVPASKCVVVEDTDVGVQSARAAGMLVFAWPHAMSENSDFPGAARILKTLEDARWEELFI